MRLCPGWKEAGKSRAGAGVRAGQLALSSLQSSFCGADGLALPPARDRSTAPPALLPSADILCMHSDRVTQLTCAHTSPPPSEFRVCQRDTGQPGFSKDPFPGREGLPPPNPGDDTMQVIPGPGRGRQRKTETGVTERGHAWGRRDKLAVTLTIDDTCQPLS